MALHRQTTSCQNIYYDTCANALCDRTVMCRRPHHEANWDYIAKHFTATIKTSMGACHNSPQFYADCKAQPEQINCCCSQCAPCMSLSVRAVALSPRALPTSIEHCNHDRWKLGQVAEKWQLISHLSAVVFNSSLTCKSGTRMICQTHSVCHYTTAVFCVTQSSIKCMSSV